MGNGLRCFSALIIQGDKGHVLRRVNKKQQSLGLSGYAGQWRVGLGLAFCALGLVGCPRSETQRPKPTRSLLILTLNDFHGQLRPIRTRSYERPRRVVRIGGGEGLLATVLSERRRRGGRVLLLDAGDFMQGSVESNSFEGAPVRALYHRMGVDAVAVGNHEFDFGPVGGQGMGTGTGGTNPTGALEAWAAGARFPVLSASIARKSGAPLGWRNVLPTALIRRAGIRVGIIGITTRDTPATTHPANIRHLTFGAHLPLVTRWARSLRARGAEVIVLLAHVGGKCKSRKASSCRGAIARLLRALPQGTVDAAIAGHSHQCMWHRINGVPLVQACDRGRALGRIEVTVGPGSGDVRARALAPLPVCHDVFSDTGDCEARLRMGAPRGRVVPNPLLARFAQPVADVRRMLAAYGTRIRPRPDTVIAHAARTVPHPRQSVSPMGTLLADVMRAAVGKADVALVNAGGVRAALAKGPITYADVYRVFPFDNQLAYADLTGRQLQQIMIDYLSRDHAGFLAVSGIRYRIRCGRPLRLTRLTDVLGRPLSDTRLYRVALSDFLLAGGVGFARVLSSVPASRKRLLKGRLIRDALVAHLKGAPQPINTVSRPIFPTGAPPIEVENGPCVPKPRKRKPRHICR
jgi:5'-nucleotidase